MWSRQPEHSTERLSRNEDHMSNVVSGQTAIVTGAAGGIGSAVVNKFVQAGINVVAVDLQQSNLDGLLDRTAGGAAKVFPLAGDVTDSTLSSTAVELAQNEFGGLDILVNNAGMGSDMVPLWEIGLDTWRRDLEVNLTSQFLMLKATIPVMVERGYGRIVNTASAAGYGGACALESVRCG